MTDAAADSPLLDEAERRQAADRAAPGPLVIHEIVREEGHFELERSSRGLAWSALAAGLSIGFSFVTQAYLQSGLPDTDWRHLVASFGYCLGFLIVVLGRQQLFTETTLTALIPTLTRRDVPSLLQTLRVWVIVLCGNLVGTFIFAAIASRPGVFDPKAAASMADLSARLLALPGWECAVRAGAAGWLIGLMVWLLPAAGNARPLIILLLTYVVAMCNFPHVIAGSVEAAYAVFTSHASMREYLTKFLVPVLCGNVVGGTALAALFNHAPVSYDMAGRKNAA